MRIKQLLHSEIVNDHTIIEIYKRKEICGSWKLLVEGYSDECKIKEFDDIYTNEFYFKDNIITVFVS